MFAGLDFSPNRGACFRTIVTNCFSLLFPGDTYAACNRAGPQRKNVKPIGRYVFFLGLCDRKYASFIRRAPKIFSGVRVFQATCTVYLNWMPA